MNKPTPAIDENGEFVVATQRDDSKVILYTLDNGRGQIVGDSRWWDLKGETICAWHPEYSLVDLPAVRATVERAAKMRATYVADGVLSSAAERQALYIAADDASPLRPSFAEAWTDEVLRIREEAAGRVVSTSELADAYGEAALRARRASEVL